MHRFRKYMLKGFKNYSGLALLFWGSLSIILFIFMIYVDYVKDHKSWPLELEVASGQVLVIRETKRHIDFKFSGPDGDFRYMPLYGQMWSNIERSLRTPDAIISVGYDPLDSGKFKTVLSMDLNDQPILTYEQSKKTFVKDRKGFSWLFCGFLLGGLYMLYGAKYNYKKRGTLWK